jgi:DNA-binding NarL/FixJ family response regulator
MVPSEQRVAKIKILVADDHDLFRRGVRAVLESQAGWEVVEATNGREAVERTKAFHPQIAVLDMQMPGLDGVEAARRIRKQVPRVEILLIGPDESEQTIARALSVGARAYLTKSTAARDLVDAISNLAKHKPFFDTRISEFLLDRYVKSAKASSAQTLTPREREVLQLLSEGKSNKEVANLTGTSPKTIETHRARIMRKLNIGSLAELIRYAIRNRLIEP